MHRACAYLMVLLVAGIAQVAQAERHEPDQVCCVLEPGYSIDEINQRWGTTTISGHPAGNFYLLGTSGVEDIEAFAREMESDPGICAAGANYHMQTPEAIREMVIAAIGGTWDDYQDQSLTTRIGLDEAHTMSQGNGVLVAVLDTGLDPEHVAFQGRISPNGYDFIDDDAFPWETCNGIDDDGDGIVDEGYAHGSMVAGIVALVAPQATILPIRVLNDEGCGTVYGVTRGILYAVEQGANVLNMSFGIPVDVPTLWPELTLADQAGVIMVSGAGNEGQEDPPYYPAVDPLVYMVTALDSLDVHADFADFHNEVTVAAPGVGVRSAYPGNEWGIGSGCSFAVPFVTGEIALIQQLIGHVPPGEDDLGTRQEIEDRIRDAVTEIYDIPGNEAYEDMLGTGRIFLPEALDELLCSTGERGREPMRLAAWPNPSFGSFQFRLQAPGDATDALIITDAGGRTVRALNFPAQTTVTWDARDQAGRAVPAGLYWARTRRGTRAIPLTLLR